MESTTATQLLERLSPAEIRARLAALDAEQHALRVLLRAALRLAKGKSRQVSDGNDGNERTAEAAAAGAGNR